MVDVSRIALHAIDGALGEIRGTVRGGEAEPVRIRRAIDRLSWALDGRPVILDSGSHLAHLQDRNYLRLAESATSYGTFLLPPSFIQR